MEALEFQTQTNPTAQNDSAVVGEALRHDAHGLSGNGPFRAHPLRSRRQRRSQASA
jgi:hypothetical protein